MCCSDWKVDNVCLQDMAVLNIYSCKVDKLLR